METKARQEKPHALVLPVSFHSHVAPMMQLAQRLASSGCIISFATNERVHAKILQSAAQCSPSTLNPPQDIRLVSYPDGLQPLPGARDVSTLQVLIALISSQEAVDQLIQRINNQGPPITCIISDIFILWAHDLAEKYDVPLVAFWAASAAVFSLYLHAPLLLSNGILPLGVKGPTEDFIDIIPGLPQLRVSDIPLSFQKSDATALKYLALMDQLEALPKVACVLVNSFFELESRVFHALREASVATILPVGPLLPFFSRNTENPEGSPENGLDISVLPEGDACLNWLDKQAPSSVLFVSFGSMDVLTASQVQEVALALESSEQPFLWVIRPLLTEATITDDLPAGFAARTEEQGLVVPWASQLRVLGHAAVGGFLSHCGWNSTIESMAMGVPILAWPQASEQNTNCKLIREEWRCGIEVRKGEGGAMVGREELERGIRQLMRGEEGIVVRKKAGEVRDSAQKALLVDGSSHASLQAFVHSLHLLGGHLPLPSSHIPSFLSHLPPHP